MHRRPASAALLPPAFLRGRGGARGGRALGPGPGWPGVGLSRAWHVVRAVRTRVSKLLLWARIRTAELLARIRAARTTSAAMRRFLEPGSSLAHSVSAQLPPVARSVLPACRPVSDCLRHEVLKSVHDSDGRVLDAKFLSQNLYLVMADLKERKQLKMVIRSVPESVSLILGRIE